MEVVEELYVQSPSLYTAPALMEHWVSQPCQPSSVSSERWQDPPAMSDSDLASPQQTEQKIKGPEG